MAKRTKEELLAIVAPMEIEKEVENYITRTVQSKGYTNENSIAKYLVQGNPFYEECVTISLWIGNVWKTANDIRNDVVAGNRGIPEDIISELPTLSI